MYTYVFPNHSFHFEILVGLNASPSLTFLEELNNTLKKNEVKKFYSSGMCIRGQASYYEGYIADPQFNSLEKLKCELKKLVECYKLQSKLSCNVAELFYGGIPSTLL